MNVQTNDKTEIKMDTQRVKTNDMEEPTSKTHANKYKGSNMVREWLKKTKNIKKS